MINLKLRTEYNFRRALGSVKTVVNCCNGAAGIADPATWGHVPFFKECKAQGIKPLLGLEVPVVKSLERVKQEFNNMTLIAKNYNGLKKIYELVSLSTKQFYYIPRLTYEQVNNNNLIILSGDKPNIEQLLQIDDYFIEASPNGSYRFARKLSAYTNKKIVVCNDNYYPKLEHEKTYHMFVGKQAQARTTPMHILSEAELKILCKGLQEESFKLSEELAQEINIELPQVENIKFPHDGDKAQLLRQLCEHRPLNAEEQQRLDFELDLIEKKGFIDYFLVVADLVREMKKIMLVGPGRGSAAGSFVCYLLNITTLDPIKHGLMFERFIDITRLDFPDIDIDFPDSKRETVINYLVNKYGEECVNHIGTISRYKPRSVITDIARELKIKPWEVEEVKKTADEFGLEKALELDFVKKNQELTLSRPLLNHARHTGVHAAGIIVCNTPITDYCGVDHYAGCAQVDKKVAEDLNILKLDILGLRTLSVLQDAAEQANINLYDISTDDPLVFELFNSGDLTGVFQFEGDTLKSVVGRIKVENFNDITAVTSLARPGPLQGGGTDLYINRKNGSGVEYSHPLIEEITRETYGVFVYEEQMLRILRELGGLSWESITVMRKALKRGDIDTFGKYEAEFLTNYKNRELWETIKTFGAYAFNKSHAASYSLISYWSAWFKVYHPLAFIVASLNDAKDKEQSIALLREAVNRGYKFKPYDPELSTVNWSVHGGVIIGGLTNIDGIAQKTAESIIESRLTGKKITAGTLKKLLAGNTPFDNIFPIKSYVPDIYQEPEKYGILSLHPSYIKNVQYKGTYIIVAKVDSVEEKDINDYNEKKTKYKHKFLNLVLTDDTDSIKATVDRWNYNKMNFISEGDILLIKGEIKSDYRKIKITKVKKL